MTPRASADGSAKKPRWSTAKKNEARRSAKIPRAAQGGAGRRDGDPRQGGEGTPGQRQWGAAAPRERGGYAGARGTDRPGYRGDRDTRGGARDERGGFTARRGREEAGAAGDRSRGGYDTPRGRSQGEDFWPSRAPKANWRARTDQGSGGPRSGGGYGNRDDRGNRYERPGGEDGRRRFERSERNDTGDAGRYGRGGDASGRGPANRTWRDARDARDARGAQTSGGGGYDRRGGGAPTSGSSGGRSEQRSGQGWRRDEGDRPRGGYASRGGDSRGGQRGSYGAGGGYASRPADGARGDSRGSYGSATTSGNDGYRDGYRGGYRSDDRARPVQDDRGGRPWSNDQRDQRDQRGERTEWSADGRELGGREWPGYRRESSQGDRPRARTAYGSGSDRAPRDGQDRRPERRPGHRPDPHAEHLRRQERPTRTPRYDDRVSQPVAVPQEVEIAEDNGFAALGLPDALVRRLAQDKITTPFAIQTAALPDGIAGRDVLGRGQTGSGKTLAFGLAVLTRLLDKPKAAPNRPRSLILVPTRELAMQVAEALGPLGRSLGLNHQLVAGGLSYTPQIVALDRGVDVLIATPGRLIDLMERGAAILDDVTIVVLDEADHMAEMGFMPEVTTILDAVPEGGQRLLFSATLDHGVDALVQRYLTDPVTHSTDDATAAVTTMEHHIFLIEPMHKKAITADVASREGRTLVFCRTKLGADRVALQLREQGVFAAALHGGLNMGARNRVITAFRDGTLPVLVATDLAARGIHVDDVSVVIQVDPPKDHKDYLHRSGRTARAGERGTVVTLALPHQRKAMERLARDAGLSTKPTQVSMGDDHIAAVTGAVRASGVPISEERHRRLVEGPPKTRRYVPKRANPRFR